MDSDRVSGAPAREAASSRPNSSFRGGLIPSNVLGQPRLFACCGLEYFGRGSMFPGFAVSLKNRSYRTVELHQSPACQMSITHPLSFLTVCWL